MSISTQAHRRRRSDASPVTVPPPLSAAEHYAISQFLYFEAQLLDEARYNDWFDLLDSDIHYFMPLRRNQLHRDLERETSVVGELAHYDDDKVSLAIRIRRLQQPTAWSDNPPPRTTRLITNIQAEPDAESGQFRVRSVFHLYRNRLQDDVDTFTGYRDDTLATDHTTGFRVQRRVIHLSQSVVLAKNLGVFF